MLIASALTCLALNIYYEARSESVVGQRAVAQVTMNRAKRDPKNICKVVSERKQFSWTNDHKMHFSHGRILLGGGIEPKEEKAWMQAKQIAFYTVCGYVKDFTGGAMFYHTKDVKPYWSKEFKLVAVIGRHKFYRNT